MHLSISAVLATMMLLAGQTLAQCDAGFRKGSAGNWKQGAPCPREPHGEHVGHDTPEPGTPEPDGIFVCGHRDALVVFSNTKFTIRPVTTDTTFRINCGDDIAHFYYCPARNFGTFDDPCAGRATKGVTVETMVEV
ncbi:hypothetical protein E4U54_002652 [Claviceps lovelessii]|nr:hypothetical protein E4U54_002652 [Claviceps lovelessii]